MSAGSPIPARTGSAGRDKPSALDTFRQTGLRVAGGGAGQYGDGWLQMTVRLTILPSRTLK